MTQEKYLKSPVFVCGHRKSGTTLLINLLDNHPELLVYPDDSGFFYMYYPICDSKDYTDEEKINIIINKLVPNLNNKINLVTEEDGSKIKFNPVNFVENIKNELKSNPNFESKDVLLSLIKSFKKTFGKNKNIKSWVEKTTSSEIYALDIKEWFPDAKFIHLLRDPRDNWASLKTGWEKRYKEFNDCPERLMQSLIERGKLGMEFAKHNQEILGKDCYKIIKFEELTQNPEKILRSLCEFLGITFNESLLYPTILGRPWGGNNFENLKFKKISSINANRWRERITEKEAMLIEYHFAEIMSYFDYKLEFSLKERTNIAKEHYKWHNFSQKYSYSTEMKNIK